MNVSLTPELERLINRKVKSGHYGSASEVVRESLRLLEERDQLRQLRLDQLRQEVARGVEQLDTGEFAEMDEAGLKKAMAKIKSSGRRKLASRRKPHP